MSNVMTISKRTASGLEEVLRTLSLDAESKVPAERLRIVGAIADGAIIESGSNSNGYWAKFADGTLVCWLHPQTPVIGEAEINLSRNGRYESANIVLTPPHAFVGGCCAVGCIWCVAGSSSGVSADISGHGSGNVYVRLWSNQVKDTNTYYIHYIAIGKWK